jgi:RHS repeat-associated protein
MNCERVVRYYIHNELVLNAAVTDSSGSTALAYDAADHLTQITYPSGRIVTYARNSLGQVAGVATQQTALAANQNVATGVAWKPMSDLMASMAHGNGIATTAAYDLDYRLASLMVQDGATLLSSLSYAYGDGMNLTAITDTLAPANSAALTYSPANRLAQANGNWGTMSLAYDGVGNRLSQATTLAAVTTTRLSSYDALSNRITGMTENAAALRSYAYDGAGNIVSDTRPGEIFAFSYNARNRPASVTRNSVAYASYSYNAFEELVARSTTAPGGPSGTVHYIHDLDGHIIAEADAATGATTRDYIWMASNDNTPTDLPLAMAEGASLYHVHTDHLGRPTRMTDAAKASVWQAAYNPHGEAASLSGTISNNLRFPGQVFQIETGLAYNWHRHYDATTGRYTQADPLRFVDGPSIYAYVSNSPYMMTDREGRAVDTAADIAFILYDLWKLWKDGECNRSENLTALGMDLAGMAIPGATGLGMASRLGKAAKGAATTRAAAGTLKGLGNIGSHGVVDAGTALSAGSKWLGAGYKEIASGVFRSADGLRQFRMTNADLLPTHGNIGSHVHFEALDDLGKVIENLHLQVTP